MLSEVGSSRLPAGRGAGAPPDSTAPVTPTASAATIAPAGSSVGHPRREISAVPTETSSSAPAATNPP
ncbi:hypothetical protein DFR68_111166 [Nocardia mexicana]|uniref:Uncharacterized protein n=2 Tax=Nocardia mexicana TaxID=279262 RepID=A0A370GRS1_9NOCA|nr:hypothetical protein DFR68_111166 [Nocardia mexicana]